MHHPSSSHVVESLSLRIKNTLGTIVTHNVTIAILVVVLGALVYGFHYKSNEKGKENYIVKKVALRETVAVSGKVAPTDQSDISFESGGKIKNVLVKSGSFVHRGDTIAILDDTDANLILLKARASYDKALADMSLAKNGPRQEELALKKQVSDNAANSLLTVYASLPDTLRSIDTITSDVLTVKLSSAFRLSSGRYAMTFSSCGQNLQSKIETQRNLLDAELLGYEALLSSKRTDASSLEGMLIAGTKLTQDTSVVVDDMNTLLTLSCSLQDSSLDTLRSTVSTARSTLTSLFAAISTQKSLLTAGKNTKAQADADLSLLKSGTNPETIASLSALLSAQDAAVKEAERSLSKTTLLAPFDGYISSLSAAVGESVSPASKIATLISDNGYQVEMDVREIDIAKIRLGQSAEITLDAFGKGTHFQGHVTRIVPVPIDTGGVPLYKIVVDFDQKYQGILSGMTANCTVITNEVSSLALPPRFVEVRNESQGFVLKDASSEKIPVALGIRGENGLIEIKSGLKEEDKVVAFDSITRSAQKTDSP